jgi:hypothetical protein
MKLDRADTAEPELLAAELLAEPELLGRGEFLEEPILPPPHATVTVNAASRAQRDI